MTDFEKINCPSCKAETQISREHSVCHSCGHVFEGYFSGRADISRDGNLQRDLDSAAASMAPTPGIATALSLVGILAVGAGIVLFLMSFPFERIGRGSIVVTIEFVASIFYLLSGVVSGLIFLGFAKVIDLLNSIRRNTTSASV